MSAAEWMPIPGHPNYEISTSGDIRSWMPWRGQPVPRLIKQRPRPDGRLVVVLNDTTPARQHKVHILMATTFLGPRPDGHEVRHLNGDHVDNRLNNLAYGTPSDNRQDQLRHGTHWQIQKTRCPQGHRYDEQNTMVNAKGHRVCRQCNRERCAAAYRARMEKKSA